jgi:hypothetical protein
MMVRECISTYYVLFWIAVVPASDPKDLFMEHVTMFTVQRRCLDHCKKPISCGVVLGEDLGSSFWSETREQKVFGPDILQEAEKQVRMVRENLWVAQ